MKRSLLLSIFLLGVSATGSQVILIREFLTVFYGNEISIGFIFAAWLVWTAVGSFVMGCLVDRIKHGINVFCVCSILLNFSLLLTIPAIRSIKNILNRDPGELLGIFPMFASCFVILAAACIILGGMFSLGCRIYEDKTGQLAYRAGKVYALDALGSMAGGVMAGFLLVRLFNPLEVIVLISLLNLLAVIFMQIESGEEHSRSVLAGLALVLFLAGMGMWFTGKWQVLDRELIRNQWKGHNIIAIRNSIYGNILFTKQENQYSVFDNGIRLYTVPDPMASEDAVHFALLEHPDPQNILLIGGGAGGLAQEILKHPVKHLDYVELDPLIVEMSLRYLPQSRISALTDRRIAIKNMDARLFVKNTKNKYDCIIMHLGDPCTAQLNRYYTVEFFKEVSRVLNTGGIFSFGLNSSESYIGNEQRLFLRSVYAGLAKVFPDIKIIPGDTAYFLACTGNGILTYDYRILKERTGQRMLDIRYVREYYLFSRLSPEKVAYTENIFKNISNARVNRDFLPISYYYDMTFLASHSKDALFGHLLKSTSAKNIWLVVLAATAALFTRGFRKNAPLVAAGVTGFSTMAAQMVILVSFQIVHGFMIYRIGLIVAAFMVGIACGSYIIIKMKQPAPSAVNYLIYAQAFMLFYLLVLAFAISVLSQVLFFAMSYICGLIGGTQFLLVNQVYLAKENNAAKVAGFVYAWDLAGGCIGALATGIFLIPVLGIFGTCLATAMFNLAGWIILKKYIDFSKNSII